MRKIDRQPSSSTSVPPASSAAVAPRPRGAPECDRAVALGSLRERGHEDRQGGRRHDRRADALHDAPEHERRGPPRETAQQARGAEQRGSRHQDPPAAEEVARATAEQQQAAEADQVGTQDPLDAVGGEAEVPLDRGDAEDDDLRVEDHHEVDKAEQSQCFRLHANTDRGEAPN
jgi:hypothetical protein